MIWFEATLVFSSGVGIGAEHVRPGNGWAIFQFLEMSEWLAICWADASNPVAICCGAPAG